MSMEKVPTAFRINVKRLHCRGTSELLLKNMVIRKSDNPSLWAYILKKGYEFSFDPDSDAPLVVVSFETEKAVDEKTKQSSTRVTRKSTKKTESLG